MTNMKRFPLYFILTAALVLGLSSCKPEEMPKKPDPGIVDPEPNPNPEPTPNPEPEPNPEPVPPPVEESVVYYDNLDKVKSEGNGNYFNTWTDGRNMEGSGIDGVSYDGFYTTVRSSYVSMGYPGASGVNGVYYRQTGAWTAVKGIGLPVDKRSFKLSMGLHTTVSGADPLKSFQVTLSDEHGKKNHTVNYTVQQYGNWYLASSVFEIVSSETTKLNIRIEALDGGSQGRIDDLRLVTTTETASVQYDFGHSGTPDPGPEPSLKDYIERPATLKENSDYKYVDHRAKTYRTKQNVRNYEACYDIRRHNPMWVAYPCHEIYWEGGYTRPVKDPWRPDPYFSESEQSIIYASDWDAWPWSSTNGRPSDKYQYWSPMPTGKTVTKGHLMRSAERGCGNKNNPIDLNIQTFYPTNIAPESYLNETSKDSHWGMVENILPNQWRYSDTVYVVVGCYYGDNSWSLKDASNWGTTSDKSKDCIMPTARYKLVLRTKTGSTGKPIWQCSADEVMAIGFWFPQNFTGEKLSSLPPLADYIYSVSDIEKKIGSEFSFFPLAPEGVKDSYNINDWPGLSDIAGSSTQSSYSGVTTEEFNPGGKVSW